MKSTPEASKPYTVMAIEACTKCLESEERMGILVPWTSWGLSNKGKAAASRAWNQGCPGVGGRPAVP